MRSFSKSKLMALRQCPKRLWLAIHKPELREDYRGLSKSSVENAFLKVFKLHCERSTSEVLNG
jgi:hypothetical protein